MSTIVVALGGNAILEPTRMVTWQEQSAHIEAACDIVVDLIKAGHQVAITHGNGPQVGSILLQNEEASHLTPAMPLDICGAESQGMIGYQLQQSLRNAFVATGLRIEVISLITQVQVDPADRSFRILSKPIGPSYSEDKARELMKEGHYQLREDEGRGWRRVVPSPEPGAIVELEAVKHYLSQGRIVIAAGGGGIPVVRDECGRLRGVEAVIDKDLAAQRLARDIRADLLLILTDVDRVYVNYRRPNQQALERMTAVEGRRYQLEGHFRPGSMGPKVEAALRFAESGLGMAVIGPLVTVAQLLKGEFGTKVVA